ncbi:dipeptide ABC transporter ATP-binding protein [Rhodococcoides yunnanense]|uniref:dipeptide ABC transporter ATP-binding protein n=1 Tax=Rhodococcoides yunnanense TaxID=278209 RepID=UPI0009353AD5|nr:ABC transporter ATP-binding protein [Rhodococcus yunnanensis]
MTSPNTPVLEVEGLSVGYATGKHITATVKDISFRLAPGDTLALVGQSGSGKTTVARAVSGLLPSNGHIIGGSARVAGTDVVSLSRRRWRELHGSVVGYVPQDPLGSLDPLQRVGHQLTRVLLRAGAGSKSEARRRAVELLDRVGIRGAAERARAYPHELSGGQLQRVLIAISIAQNPRLLIADEPTSALDVTVQKTILDLLGDLKQDLGLAILFITHDLALASDRSDSVLVLNDGVEAEYGSARDVLGTPQHAYTARLVADAPALSPDRYADRAHAANDTDAPAITVSGLTKTFGSKIGGQGRTTALDDVGFDVLPGEIHAIVGESGSGKTTAARIIAGLTPFDSGTVTVAGHPVSSAARQDVSHATTLQLIYQNPLSALDPRFDVESLLDEPLVIHHELDRAARRTRIDAILDDLALAKSLLGRLAVELSGGQRQRVALARALMLDPRILVLDEPTSALDVSVQAQIIDLLIDLRARKDLTYVFISHDLSLVRQIADRVTVLEAGRVVESRATRPLFAEPATEYTRKLIDAIPGRGAVTPPHSPANARALA